MQKFLFLLAALIWAGLPLVDAANAADDDRLARVLAAQADDVRARYKHRHPAETLAFFEIEPGMTVVDTLPGGGWYTKILLPYLGAGGKVIGADYAADVWLAIGYDGEDFQASRKTWITDWKAQAAGWRDDRSAGIDAFVLGAMPAYLHGTADAVLFVRALHNLAYPAGDARHLVAAIQDAYDILKPGGIVGVVQHHARDAMPDAWANGENGYLKQGYVIDMLEAAGFEFVAASAVNANHRDMPTHEQYVWRLPPGYDGADSPEARAKVDAIGESNRMTLKFRKP